VSDHRAAEAAAEALHQHGPTVVGAKQTPRWQDCPRADTHRRAGREVARAVLDAVSRAEPTVTDVTLDGLMALHEKVAKSDEGEPWVAHYDADAGTSGRWSIGPDYEMGHRAELDGWCTSEALLLTLARNALPALVAEVRHLRAKVEVSEG